jgi:uncharacterized protein (TIGR03435 family)
MRLAVTLLLACGGITAQPAVVAPAFEVASFKRLPADAPRRGSVYGITPAGINFHVTLGNCISWAWGYQNFQVAGPKWRDYPTDVIYDIVAKAANPVPESQLKVMLQELLKERLGLAYHLETRDLPVYALVVARNGPKFHKSETEGDPSMDPVPGRTWAMTFKKVSMAQLAQVMDPPVTSRHIVDETGLAGAFDFTLDLSPYILDPETGKQILDSTGRIDEESAYIGALPWQLGLRLEPKRAPLEVMVIDHVEKDPTAN